MPSTLFISLTDCSSPNPRAAAAAAAHKSPQNAWEQDLGRKSLANGIDIRSSVKVIRHLIILKTNKNS